MTNAFRGFSLLEALFALFLLTSCLLSLLAEQHYNKQMFFENLLFIDKLEKNKNLIEQHQPFNSAAKR